MAIQFDAEDKLLKEILAGTEKYKIPRYQRPYVWGRDEIVDLWNDLKDEESSFLGSFVFNYEAYEKEKFVEIIDGQQRLITLTILMAVLRDLYEELGEERGSARTQTTTIAHEDPITGEQDYRLKCGETLDKFFRENIQKEGSTILSISSKGLREEEKKIKDNYEFFRNEILKELESEQEQSKKVDYLDDLKSRVFKLKIIWIRIENDDDAYSIFETVNARGADLTAADLLKNYLFSKIQKSTDGVDEAKTIWSTIENNIEKAKGPLTLSKFIRYYWLSRYAFVPEKKLYKAVKNTITKPESFLLDLLKASEYYYKLANDSVGANTWAEEFENPKTGQKIFEAIKGLRIMGITQCYSLLFCLLLSKDKINFNFSEVIKKIEQYHFVYSAICKLSGNVVERLYYHTASEIQEALTLTNKEKRTKVLERILATFVRRLDYPTKDFFVERFMDIEYKNYPLVIYTLSNIERVKGYTEENSVDFTKVNIEHILPQDPTEWGYSKKEIKDYVNKLGNLTLIAKTINGPMGNKPLKEKAELFKKSKLNINQELVTKFKQLQYKWSEKAINDRQKELAEFAYDVVWKFR